MPTDLGPAALPPAVRFSPPTAVFRVAYGPDPFRPVPWAILRQRDPLLTATESDARSGGRFDDLAARSGLPEVRRFRTIYCASQPEAAFGEVIGPRRVPLDQLRRIQARVPTVPAGLAEISDDEPLDALLAGLIDPTDPTRGIVPRGWYQRRLLGSTVLDPALPFVDLTAGQTVQHLRQALAVAAADLGIADIDYSTIVGPNRRFTQLVATHVYEQLDDDRDQPRYAGLTYRSRYNPAWECWAIFDQRLRHQPVALEPIIADDPDLQAAAGLLHLTIEGPTAGDYRRPSFDPTYRSPRLPRP